MPDRSQDQSIRLTPPQLPARPCSRWRWPYVLCCNCTGMHACIESEEERREATRHFSGLGSPAVCKHQLPQVLLEGCQLLPDQPLPSGCTQAAMSRPACLVRSRSAARSAWPRHMQPGLDPAHLQENHEHRVSTGLSCHSGQGQRHAASTAHLHADGLLLRFQLLLLLAPQLQQLGQLLLHTLRACRPRRQGLHSSDQITVQAPPAGTNTQERMWAGAQLEAAAPGGVSAHARGAHSSCRRHWCAASQSALAVDRTVRVCCWPNNRRRETAKQIGEIYPI